MPVSFTDHSMRKVCCVPTEVSKALALHFVMCVRVLMVEDSL